MSTVINAILDDSIERHVRGNIGTKRQELDELQEKIDLPEGYVRPPDYLPG